jgi:hypothetical protein
MEQNVTLAVPDGYAPARVRTPKPMIEVRTMTYAEAVNAPSHIDFVSVNGEVRRCKVNGRTKTWKTRSADLELPVKYGMYETGRFSMRNGRWIDAAYPVVRVTA